MLKELGKEIQWAGQGYSAVPAEGPGSPLPFIRQSGQAPEQGGKGEKPQTSCPHAGMHRNLGEGRNREEWGTEEK